MVFNFIETKIWNCTSKCTYFVCHVHLILVNCCVICLDTCYMLIIRSSVKRGKYKIPGARRVRGEASKTIYYYYYLFHRNVFVWEFLICVLICVRGKQDFSVNFSNVVYQTGKKTVTTRIPRRTFENCFSIIDTDRIDLLIVITEFICIIKWATTNF